MPRKIVEDIILPKKGGRRPSVAKSPAAKPPVENEIPVNIESSENEASKHLNYVVRQKTKTDDIDEESSFTNRIGGSGGGHSRSFTTGDGDGSSRHSNIPLWIGAIALLIFVLFVIIPIFSGATIKVVPVQVDVVPAGELVAHRDAEQGELPFNLIIVGGEKSKEIPTTIEKEVNRKASGDIVVYNAYSSQKQRLIKNTRFEADNGKIYRIDQAITVPGTDVVDGEIVPGSVEVTVYADVPGSEYNSDPTDFTIPGLGGDPRFSKFYARSSAPISGGFSGTVKTVSDEDVESVSNELSSLLIDELIGKARAQVPEGFMLFDEATFTLFGEQKSLPETKEDNVAFTREGTLYAVIFNKQELANYIAQSFIVSYDGSGVSIRNIDSLGAIVSDKKSFDPLEDDEFRFTIDGNAHIVWDIDESALKTDLLGVHEDSFGTIVRDYSSIKKAEAVIRPFWESKFPEKLKKITIEEVLEENLD